MKKISIILSLLLIMAIPTTIKAEVNDNIGSIYETKKKSATSKARSSEEVDMPKEYVNDIKAINDIEYLKLKTNSNYEVALAYEDGSYSYVQSTDNIEKAMDIANSQKKKVKSNVIPVVVNKEGLVVYATNSIGRIVKVVSGKNIELGHKDYTKYTTKIYDKENSKYDIASLNHGFIDDAPIIEDNGTRVKVQVNGVTGWIDKKDNEGTNIIAVPINQAKNLSYYMKNKDGSLTHYISYDIKSESKKGHSKIIGVAPSFMKVGQEYYSYDAKYFYTNINDLLSDLQNNQNTKAVNKSNPFYNYYTYVPARHKSSYSVAEINNYLEKKTPKDSVLKNKGKAFVDAQNKYGMSANMILGIAMNESSKGTSDIAKSKKNIFGLRVYDDGSLTGDSYKSVEACIDNFGSGWMSNWYLNPNYSKYSGSNLGNKAVGINVRYAADPYWGEKAAGFMYEMDKYISGSGKLIEYNKHDIGILTSKGNITNSKGETLYYIVSDRSQADPLGKGNRNAKIGEPVIILSKSGSNVEIYPDRQVPYSGNKLVTYDWNVKGKVSTSNVNVLNNKESNTRSFNNFTVNSFNISSTSISGKGPYDSTVKVLKDGKQIGKSVKIGTSESYKVEIPKQKAGTKLVVEISKSGYKKTSKTLTVLNKFKTLSVNTVDKNSKYVTGKGLKGATVKAYVSGKQIGKTVKVDSKGNYKVSIPKQSSGKEITVKMSKSGYVTTEKKTKVLNVFSKFTVSSVTSKSKSISGSGTSGATVTAYVGDKKIGSKKVSSSKYKMSIKAQKKKKKITVKMSKSGYKTIEKTITVK